MTQLDRDKSAIIRVLSMIGYPMTKADVAFYAGDGLSKAWDALLIERIVTVVKVENGRQFWALI